MDAPLPRTQLPPGALRKAVEDDAEQLRDDLQLQDADARAAQSRAKKAKTNEPTAMARYVSQHP